MFKLNAYSTGKLPLTLCLCRNSIKIIADAAAGRALQRKHPLVPPRRPRRSSGCAGPQPPASASSISGQAGRWRQQACVILTDMYQRQHRVLSLSQGSRRGAAAPFPSKGWIVHRPCDRAACYTQFCFYTNVAAIYMIWNDPLKFKLQFPINFVSSPEEGAGEWIKKENGLNKRYLLPELAGFSLLLTEQLYGNK